MSKKSGKIAALIAECQGQVMDAHYLGYFKCFNAGYFYEAHDVLEELWLTCRKEPHGDYYKALIQLAGAFVHLQKNRLKPAAALFRLSASYLESFRPQRESLDVEKVLDLINHWLSLLEAGHFERNPLETTPAPTLKLQD